MSELEVRNASKAPAVSGDAAQSQFLHYQQQMEEVIREMREIPVLPSEVIKDKSTLQRVEFPKEGGIYTYMEGYDYPYKGFPYFEFVEKVDLMKKTQRAILSSLFHSLKRRNKLQLLCLILVPWLFRDLASASLMAFFRLIERFKIKPLRYSPAIQELHRAMSFTDYDENVRDRETRYMARDVLCMLLEFDNAYRYRFQDVIVTLDKGAAEKNPAAEIIRMLELLQSREKTQEVRDTWTLGKRFLPLYLRFTPKVRKAVARALQELDLRKVALDDADKCFCALRKDYRFGFMERGGGVADPEAEYYSRLLQLHATWEVEKAKALEGVTTANAQLVAKHQKEYDELKLTQKESDIVEKEVPEALRKVDNDMQAAMHSALAQVEQLFAERKEQVRLAMLPDAFYNLQKRHHEERVIQDAKNEETLKQKEEEFNAGKKKLKNTYVSNKFLSK